ncbi:hypothetical protein F5882DRAFT_518183 [Hyaloscypha sp. PMI_1271]|nr:hypothetical protein F5882DRAFT_518183 [Hyaloscypha sp. PMI_1271]
MASSPEDNSPNAGLQPDCRHPPDKKPDGSCGCHQVGPVASSACWPGPQVAPEDAFMASNKFRNLDRLLPNTQRNRTSSPTDSQNMTTMLHKQGKSLPDTQRNFADHQDILITPTSLKLPGTEINVFQGIQSSENLRANLDQYLPDSPTQILDRGHALGTTAVGSDSQFSETQINQFSSKGTDELVDDNPELQLLDTQSNTAQWISPLLSSKISPPPSQDFLILDTLRTNGGSEARYQTLNTSIRLTQSHKNLTDTQISSANDPEVPNLADIPFLRTGVDLKTSQSSIPKVPFNKITCRERKRIIVSSNRPPALTKAMCQWVDNTNYLLDPFRGEEECWFHPSPPPAHLSMNGVPRPCGKLQKRFNWNDRHEKHSLVLNFGIASKLANYKMTKQQKDGFINKQWHLSHLCGNWTCLNPAHTTVEPGNVNISRNNCFSHRSGCLHNPPCMKDKKVPLGADGKLVDHTASISINSGPIDIGEWDDWSAQGFDDGDDFVVDNDEDSEFPAYHNNGDSVVIVVEDEAEL